MSEKQCSQCGRAYSNSYNFCLEDGTPLSFSFASEETLISRSLNAKSDFPAITIQNGDLLINKKQFVLPTSIDDIELWLGEADRRETKAQIMIHFWDRFGVAFVENLSSFEVIVLRIQVNRDLSQEIKLRKSFRGQLIWDGVLINEKSTISSIANEKSGEPLIQNSEMVWSLKHERSAISVLTNPEQIIVAIAYARRHDGSAAARH